MPILDDVLTHICTRLISVTAKCTEQFAATMGSIEWEGDIPPELKNRIW
jgi:hypothetical protein